MKVIKISSYLKKKQKKEIREIVIDIDKQIIEAFIAGISPLLEVKNG